MIFFVRSREISKCPICECDLEARDSRKRNCTRKEAGKRIYRIRRLRCTGCGKLHNELPDFMVPHKHYDAATIEAELDGRGNDCRADDSTINRWKKMFKDSKEQLEGALRSLWTRVRAMHYPLHGKSLLQSIRDKGKGWLSFVNRLLCAANLKLHTLFAWCPSP
jgi:hypothetical protein